MFQVKKNVCLSESCPIFSTIFNSSVFPLSAVLPPSGGFQIGFILLGLPTSEAFRDSTVHRHCSSLSRPYVYDAYANMAFLDAQTSHVLPRATYLHLTLDPLCQPIHGVCCLVLCPVEVFCHYLSINDRTDGIHVTMDGSHLGAMTVLRRDHSQNRPIYSLDKCSTQTLAMLENDGESKG